MNDRHKSGGRAPLHVFTFVLRLVRGRGARTHRGKAHLLAAFACAQDLEENSDDDEEEEEESEEESEEEEEEEEEEAPAPAPAKGKRPAAKVISFKALSFLFLFRVLPSIHSDVELPAHVVITSVLNCLQGDKGGSSKKKQK
jgi:hypothetical protein